MAPIEISRRRFIYLAGMAGAALLTGCYSNKPESPQPETLKSLVAEAKKTEDEYKSQDLSNKPIREKYAGVLAGIFTFHYPEYFSRQQLVETITWTDTLDQFVRNRMASAGKTGTPTVTQLENERYTTAATDNRRRKVTVNAAANAFKQQNIKLIRGAPKGWNPLSTLRISLLHEFNHLVVENKDEVIFSIMDPSNKFKDRRIEGFRFMGIDEKGNFVSSFNDLHEGVVELLTKDISQSDFGSHITNFLNESTGEDITALIARLEAILQVTGISHPELARFHKSSDFRGFLLLLADKAEISTSEPLDNRIKAGSLVVGAIERNGQRLLQQYIDQVRSTNPTNSQK